MKKRKYTWFDMYGAAYAQYTGVFHFEKAPWPARKNGMIMRWNVASPDGNMHLYLKVNGSNNVK